MTENHTQDSQLLVFLLTLLRDLKFAFRSLARVKGLAVLPSPSILGALASIHATTSFDAAVAVPGEIYSRAMNSLSHRN